MDFITYAKSKKYTNQKVASGGNLEETKELIAQEVSKVVTTVQGPKGDTGAQGPQGERGEVGPQGPQGVAGPQGEAGDDFTYEDFTPEQLAALKGEKGDTGAQGPKGDTGEVGPQGEAGETGPQGPKGDTGAAFTFDMFTAEQLELLRGPAGKDGATGPQGEQGPQGEIGETGPQGPKGDTGAQGEQGPAGEAGVQGAQGPAGADGKTPVKGTDYWTAEDVAAMVEEVKKTNDPLAGKTVLCLGDSLMAGNGWEGGFANCLKENHPEANIINVGISGATLISSTTSSVPAQLNAYKEANGTGPDVIIFDGGGNDGMLRSEFGTGVLDKPWTNGHLTTACDALDYMLNAIRKNWPDTRVLYINTPKLMPWLDENGAEVIPGPALLTTQTAHVELLEAICHKWGVPIADLHRKSQIPSFTEEIVAKYFIDTIHYNEAGYRAVSPIIENALKDLF